LIFCGFAASGFLKWLYFRIFHKTETLPAATILE
jgi:hypothetical protein